ncbi:MAG: hypothetical protein PHH14_04195 [Candidatus Margulisbacteria bacterium]|nr:hypothetical protein [Candidatus Margulisiibacteriota bacterium]
MLKRFGLGLAALFLVMAFTMLVVIGCGTSTSTNTNPVAQDYGTLAGLVTDSSGTVLSGVTVTAASTSGATNSQGWFALTNVAASSELKVVLSKSGYVDNEKTTSIVSGRQTYITASMIASATSQSLTVASGGSLSFTTGSVSFPANAFEYSDGTAFTGSTATITLTAGGFSTSTEADSFPGRFEGLDASSNRVTFESFGWVDIHATDASGSALRAKSTVTWTLTVNNAVSRTPALTSVPVWYYSDGEWRAATDPTTGVQYNATYNSTADSFVATIKGGDFSGTPWNIDLPWQTTAYIKGRIVDYAGNAVANALVQVRSSTNNWLQSYYTGSDGRFTMPVNGNQAITVLASKGEKTSGVTSVTALSPTTYTSTSPYDVGDILLETPRIQVTLTWGVDPSDLDSHMTIPKETTSSTYRYHLYYGNRSTTPSTSYPYANLDTDDRTSYGPEHTTIYRLYEGTYRFCVHHYAGSSDIQSSSARVDLNVDDGVNTPATYTFTPPSGQASDKTVWMVFDVNVDSSGKITSVNTLGSYGTQSKDTYDPGGAADTLYTSSAAKVMMVK